MKRREDVVDAVFPDAESWYCNPYQDYADSVFVHMQNLSLRRQANILLAVYIPDRRDHCLSELMQLPGDVREPSKSLLERFVVLMYGRTSGAMEVNEARKQLFT
ncbi:unnamed protein product [Pleuronectes platessa]|uniref:Uncharacterized protein n=1 Tax=Pleuronectes platessa TaxID=8262 RepID=A0A9N7VWJ3_PLEPL|nr:unnamed protein product [Pleuronectes platessa]